MINKKKYITRSPIVTIAGHIDHGKTTLLNKILEKKKIEKEIGGITQYIRPYSKETKFGKITFLDTPGHNAFNSIRKKSIKYSDIVVLIIAADDGIKGQTIEVINSAKYFKKPIIVAINKIDKVKYKNNKIVNDLSKYELTPEEWGGDTLTTLISAKTGEGVEKLLELIKLQSEILDLKSIKNINADGFVLENKVDKKKGVITTLITLNGEIKKGDTIQVKNSYGKIKKITTINEKEIEKSIIAVPIYVIGMSSDLDIGEKFLKIENRKKIKTKINENEDFEIRNKVYDIKNIIKNIKNNKKEDKINLIIKVDVKSNINVFNDIINEFSKKNKINLIKIELGNIKESDIDLSEITKSKIIGFNVTCNNKIKKNFEKDKEKIKIFYIIYDFVDYIKEIIEKNNKNKQEEDLIGLAKVKKIFLQDKFKVIAGCIITKGKIKKNSKIKIIRKNIIIHNGYIESIKVFKNNIEEVKSGNECGIVIKNFNKININDLIKVF